LKNRTPWPSKRGARDANLVDKTFLKALPRDVGANQHDVLPSASVERHADSAPDAAGDEAVQRHREMPENFAH
jgi:hypothetical protein